MAAGARKGDNSVVLEVFEVMLGYWVVPKK
jgi:hypothetical protein